MLIKFVFCFTINRKFMFIIYLMGHLNGCCLPSEVQYLCIFSVTKVVISDVLDQSSGLMLRLFNQNSKNFKRIPIKTVREKLIVKTCRLW